jgi:hypothetical protein
MAVELPSRDGRPVQIEASQIFAKPIRVIRLDPERTRKGETAQILTRK